MSPSSSAARRTEARAPSVAASQLYMIRFGGTFRFSVSVVGIRCAVFGHHSLRRLFSEGTPSSHGPARAAGYVLVLTSTQAGAFSPHEILELYRCRWQIEMTFKRLKSLIALDTLPAKDPQLARTFLYSKLLAALLVEDLMWKYLAFSPWGTDFTTRPPCIWRIQRVLLQSMTYAILGPLLPTAWVHKAPRLQRHFFDAPRKRKKQAAHAQLFAQRIQLS